MVIIPFRPQEKKEMPNLTGSLLNKQTSTPAFTPKKGITVIPFEPKKEVSNQSLAKIPTKLEQGTPKKKSLKDYLPTQIKEGLFGKVDEFVARTGRTPETLQEQAVTSGLLSDNPIIPFVTRSKTVKSDLLEKRLIKDGADPNRAFQIAQTMTNASPMEKGKAKEGLNLSGSEKKSLLVRNFAEGAGAITDLPGGFVGRVAKVAAITQDATKIAKRVNKADYLLLDKYLNGKTTASEFIEAERLVNAFGVPLNSDEKLRKQFLNDVLRESQPRLGIDPNDVNIQMKKGSPKVNPDNVVDLQATKVDINKDPLTKEIQSGKYKSAEEFVRAQTPRVGGIAPELQGQTLYRGMSEAEWQAIQAGGVSGKASKGGRTFLTTEKQTADMAVEAGKGKGVVVELKPEAGQKVISGGKIGENAGGNLPGEYQARDIGIDDIAKVTDGNGKVIYEATTGGKTKSQLTDFYNKVNNNYTKGTDGKLLGSIPSNKLETIELSRIKTSGELDDAFGDLNVGENSMTKLPVLAQKNADGTYEVIDGNHRVARAMRDGKKDIQVITDEKIYRELSEKAEKIKDPLTQKGQEIKLLHGTNKKFDVFDTAKRGMNEQDFQSKNAFFFTDSLDTAKSYGKNVMERYGSFEKPLVIDAKGEMYSGGSSATDMKQILRDAVEKAKKEGNDVVIIKNLSDRKDWGNYEPATHYAVLDVSKLKTKSQLTDFYNKVNNKGGQEAFGVGAGFEQDEEGNVRFNPTNAALGVLGVGIIKNPRAAKAFEKGMEAAKGKFLKDQALLNLEQTKQLVKGKPSFWQHLKETFAPMKYQEPVIKEAWKTRIAGMATANEKANEQFVKLSHIPEKEGFETILKYQAGEETKYTKEIKDTFDSLFKEATDRGLEFGYTKNYIPQVYANSKEEVIGAVADYMKANNVPEDVIKEYLDGKPLPQEFANALKLVPSFTKERAFPDYKTAIQFGLTPKYSHPAQLAANYRNEMEKAISNRQWLETLKEEHVLVSTRLDGYRAVELPFSNEELFAKRDMATTLNKYFRDEDNLGLGEKVIKFGAKASSNMQSLVLSGGVPSTNVNFFTIGQAVKDLTAAEVSVVGNLYKSNFDTATRGWFRANQPYISKMAEDGINLSGRTGNWDRVYRQLSSKEGIGRMLEVSGEKFDALFNKKTFDNFMPMQTVSVYKNTYDSAVTKGLSEVEARKFASETTKAWAGIIEDWGRGKTSQEFINAILFAPRFRESLINLFGNTIKSLSSEIRNPAFAKNRKFILGAAITYGLYNALNHKLNGEYMWQNERGKEFDLKIPLGDGKYMYTAFLPSVLAFPRNMISGGIALTQMDSELAGQKFGSLFSMPIKLTAEIASNKDYFGRPIWKEDDTRVDKLKSIAKYIGINQYNHPFVEAIYNVTFAEEGKEKDWYEVLSRMAELPFKFNSQENIDKGKFYDAMDAQQVKRNKEKEPMRKLYNDLQTMKAQGKTEEANQKYRELSKEDKELYNSIKTAEKTKATKALEAKLYPLYLELQEMKENGEGDKANEIHSQLSAEEKRVYKLLKNKFK